MKEQFGFIGKLLGYVMGIVLFGLMASYTMSFVDKLFPDDWVKTWGSLIIFDGGALIWLILYLVASEGSSQRGVAIFMFMFDIVGAGAIVAAEVFTAGSAFMNDMEMINWIRSTALYVLIGWTVVNLAMMYLHHIVDPGQLEAMKKRSFQDKVTAKALQMSGEMVDTMAADIAKQLAASIYDRTLADLGITDQSLRSNGEHTFEVTQKTQKQQSRRRLTFKERLFGENEPATQTFQSNVAGGPAINQPERILPAETKESRDSSGENFTDQPRA